MNTIESIKQAIYEGYPKTQAILSQQIGKEILATGSIVTVGDGKLVLSCEWMRVYCQFSPDPFHNTKLTGLFRHQIVRILGTFRSFYRRRFKNQRNADRTSAGG